MDELTDGEADSLRPVLRRLTKALRPVVDCQKTYVAMIAEQEGCAHLHFDVLPRMQWSTSEESGPRSLGAFLAKDADEATGDTDRDAAALRLPQALARTV